MFCKETIADIRKYPVGQILNHIRDPLIQVVGIWRPQYSGNE